MSRCIVILGVPRSGTSCVAGCLHKLGVDMGAGQFQPDDKFNPRGYYEDLRWRYANQRVTGKGYNLPNVNGIGQKQKSIWRGLAQEYSRKVLWGIKDPWMCFVGHYVWPILQSQGVEVRVVAVERDRAASVASVNRHLQSSYKGQYRYGAERIIDTWQEAMDQRLGEWGGELLRVQYEDLVETPVQVVTDLAVFAFAESGVMVGNVQLAAGWVTPELRHFGGAQ